MYTVKKKFARLRRVAQLAVMVAGIAGALAAAPVQANVDYTDLWWNPAEPGSGVNFVQSDNFIFATFFVYGPTNKPYWYTAQLTRDSNGIWKGPMYQTTGSYFAAPYNATLNDVDQVGTATFSAISEVQGTLAYTVNGVAVAKAIERQSLQMISMAGTYMGALITDVYNCDDGSPVRTLRRFVDSSVSQQVSGATQIAFSFSGGGACAINGNAVQYGQLFRLDNASYTCGTGPTTVYELHSTSLGLEGRYSAPIAGGCTEFGTFSVLLK